jgi:hypothetical protein
MPGKPFQSKLEPFYGFIRDCRAKRWSYARIAEAITREHTMSVSANAVFSFVKVRARGRKLYTLPAKVDSGSSQVQRGNSEQAGEDLIGPANSFFTPPDEASKPAHQQTEHEKRPYRLEF